MRALIALLVLLTSIPALGVAPEPAAKGPPLAEWYRPMVGNWAYEFPGGSGTSQTTYIHDERVVETVIQGVINGTPFSGTFLAAPRPAESHWKGVWVDSLGNFLDMTITRDDRVLRAEWAMPAAEGATPMLMRQDNSEFTSASYRDQLHVSTDGGETWTTVRDTRFRKAVDQPADERDEDAEG